MEPDSSLLVLISRMFRKLNREHFHSSVPMPKIRLSRRMTISAGSVQYGHRQHTLTLSIPYHDHFGWGRELLSTLKHEMIHLYLERQRGIRGHGKVFLAFCESIGTERYCKELPRKRPLHVYECPRCGTEYKYRKKVRLFCGLCHTSSGRNGRLLRFSRTIPPRPTLNPPRKKPAGVSGRAARTGRQLTLPGLEAAPLKRKAARQKKKTRSK